MRKYYTRACNFYHGSEAKRLIQTKKALPLNGKKNIAFDNIEIFLVLNNFSHNTNILLANNYFIWQYK